MNQYSSLTVGERETRFWANVSGLTVRGEKHLWYGVPKTKEERQRISEVQLGRRKHSSDLIEKIRAEIGTKSLQSLAKQFQVSKSYVQRIGAGHI